MRDESGRATLVARLAAFFYPIIGYAKLAEQVPNLIDS
jgi:hypothetical protein